MKVELRPDTDAAREIGTLPILDEAVIQGAYLVHAEMMTDQTLWIGIDGADGHRVSLTASVARVQGKYVLQLRGEDEGKASPPLRTEEADHG